MEAPERVTVMSFFVDDSRQEVGWVVELPNGDHIPMVWKVSDFGPAWGIRGTVPVPQIREFSQKMVGKQVNLIIRKGKPDGDGENIRQS